MEQTILLITPPFTQLNTPYPATAYLKGFLNTLGYSSKQADLGIEVILQLFSRKGLSAIFESLENSDNELSDNAFRIYSLREAYLSTIDPLIQFLQHKNPTLAHAICDRTYLPEASRFANLEELDWAFGTMGIQDKARHLATMYLEDLADLIKEAIDPHFGFSRYAERLASSASHFDDLLAELLAPNTIVSNCLENLLDQKIQDWSPDVVCLSVPFPGNLFAAFKCGQYLKEHYPHIKIVLGGGYANTELRSLGDERVFDFVDHVCLDDGEAPLQFLLEHLWGQRKREDLKRVFTLSDGVVSYYNGAIEKDIPQRETGTPDYSDLLLSDYLSVIELINPMHRLWSDGRWNKLTLAHGCYWGKCSFCDVSLDYIQRYEPLTPAILCDRIETIIAQTKEHGFHFVDEAAPPALLRDLSIEILRRKLTVVWWTNIRFEKSFTVDLCRLMKAAGCIAISGGLEVAADRLLERMKKGVTVAQVARVADAFSQAGIMVHAYLMYGFPTQSAQETIDSLEMVRQLFLNGVIQSGFWHQFAMTAHSPVGLDPAAFEVSAVGSEFGGFAHNDLQHEDPLGADHEQFAAGLRKSLFNYMHGICFEFDLSEWFDFETPATTIAPDYIENCIAKMPEAPIRQNALVLWLGTMPLVEVEETAILTFFHKQYEWQLELSPAVAEWWMEQMPALLLKGEEPLTYSQLKKSYEECFGDFEGFRDSDIWGQLREHGLLVL